MDSKHSFKCTGSIISPNLVVSGKIFVQWLEERMKIK